MKHTVARTIACFSLLLAAAGWGCNSDQTVRCDFRQPASLANTSWPKFQHDAQNSGAISVAPLRPGATVVAQFAAPDGAPFEVQPVLGNGSGNSPTRDGRVYVGSTSGRMYALDSRTLSPLPAEEFDFAQALPIRTTALVATRDSQEALFFGSEQGLLFAIDARGAKQSGFFPFVVGGPLGRAVALHPTDGTIYVGTSTRVQAGICPNGVLRFLATAVAPVNASPAVTAKGNIVWAADDRTLRATRNDGFLLWSVTLSATIAGAPVVEVADHAAEEAVYAVDSAGRLFKVDAATGRLVYTRLLPVDSSRSAPAVLGSPALAEGRLYVGTVLGDVHAIDTATGTVVWSHTLPGSLVGPLAVLVHAEGRSVAAASQDGNVYILEDAGMQVGATTRVPIGAPLSSGVAVSAAQPDRAILFVADEAGRVSRVE